MSMFGLTRDFPNCNVSVKVYITSHIDPDHGDLEVTPEMGDNYIGAEIMIPRGGVLSRGQVTRQKRDADGNPIGQSHTNPVLDTRSYIVEFDDNNQTELTANLIAESMYAQCDPDGNQHPLLLILLTTGAWIMPHNLRPDSCAGRWPYIP